MANDPPTCSTNSSSLRQPSSPTLPDPSRRNARSMVPPHVRGTVATFVKREGRNRRRGKMLLNIAVHNKRCRNPEHMKSHENTQRSDKNGIPAGVVPRRPMGCAQSFPTSSIPHSKPSQQAVAHTHRSKTTPVHGAAGMGKIRVRARGTRMRQRR